MAEPNEAFRWVRSLLDSSEPISLSEIQPLMESDDMEVLGVIDALLSDYRHRRRFEPKLSSQEIAQFLIRYYEMCLIRDAEGEWAHSRYGAMADVAFFWFRGPRCSDDLCLIDIQNALGEWLEGMYLRSDSDIRDAIICGALEHILEDRCWREAFSDWETHPELKVGHAQAMDWARDHEMPE